MAHRGMSPRCGPPRIPPSLQALHPRSALTKLNDPGVTNWVDVAGTTPMLEEAAAAVRRAILGGIGSAPGTFAGTLIVGLGEAIMVQLAGSEWRAAFALLRPAGVDVKRPLQIATAAVAAGGSGHSLRQFKQNDFRSVTICNPIRRRRRRSILRSRRRRPADGCGG